MRTTSIIALAIAVTAPIAIAQTAYKPGVENVAFPKDYQSTFIRYATVDKPDRKIVRYLYANPSSYAGAEKGKPLPDRTVIVMEDHNARLGPDGNPLVDQQGRYIANPDVIAVLVQEKRAGWGVGYPDTLRNGEWEYARFNIDGSRQPQPVQACFECHLKTRAGQDFAFNFWDYVQAKK